MNFVLAVCVVLALVLAVRWAVAERTAHLADRAARDARAAKRARDDAKDVRRSIRDRR